MSYALFEDVLNADFENSYLFTKLVFEICIYDFSKVESALSQIEEFSRSGYYLAGYIAYDSIFALESKLQVEKSKTISSGVPLIHFNVYEQCQKFASKQLLDILSSQKIEFEQSNTVKLNRIFLEDDILSYTEKYNQVQSELEKGNTYQVNLTIEAQLEFGNSPPTSIYYQLSRSKPVQYAAFLPYLPQELISLSPELFFYKTNNKIHVKPMKGTAPRSGDYLSDKRYYEWLSGDAKNQAENLIVVDLLRNDLSRFCKTGSVKADRLFKVEEFSTVYQMVSELSADLDKDISFTEILKGIFPCGSITGAPKLNTMRIIDNIEQRARGTYCGAIGFILPNNDMHFSVAIRTLTRSTEDKLYKFGVGGGITIRSRPDDEWNEIKTKLRFICNFYQPDFEIIESMLLVNGHIYNLSLHLERFYRSADQLMFNIDNENVCLQLKKYLATHKGEFELDQKYKLRLALAHSGKLTISHNRVDNIPNQLSVAVIKEAINTDSPMFYHKTSAKEVRGLYDDIYKNSLDPSIDELIFINENGVITESRYFNVIIEYEGQLITSPTSEGLLPGIYRQKMIADGILNEKLITMQMVEVASSIYLCNDVRGLIRCVYLGVG